MKRVLGLLNLQKKGTLINELATPRPVEMIPFGGRYRLVDFALSNMVNSGIRAVGIMLPENSRSVLDHVRSGKDWDLARYHDGLSFLPSPLWEQRYSGDLKNFYYHLNFFEHNSLDFVLVSDGNFVCRPDYNKLLNTLLETGADMALLYGKADTDGKNGITLHIAEGGLVDHLSFRQETRYGDKLYLGACLLKRRLFVELVRTTLEQGGIDFMFDAVARRIKEFRVAAAEYEGYAREINTTLSYYRTSMDLLKAPVFDELLRREPHVATKSKDKSSVRYAGSAKVSNSLIANGCRIAGEVENSILFRGVTVEEGAKVRNSIVMQDGKIGNNAVIENVICDKNAVISGGGWLRGTSGYPFIIGKDATV